MGFGASGPRGLEFQTQKVSGLGFWTLGFGVQSSWKVHGLGPCMGLEVLELRGQGGGGGWGG